MSEAELREIEYVSNYILTIHACTGLALAPFNHRMPDFHLMISTLKNRRVDPNTEPDKYLAEMNFRVYTATVGSRSRYDRCIIQALL